MTSSNACRRLPVLVSEPTADKGCLLVTILQKASHSLKPRVRHMICHGEDVVVKDYSHATPLMRETLCRYLLWREIKAMNALDGVRGVPAYLGRFGAYGFRQERIVGRPPDSEIFLRKPELSKQLLGTLQSFQAAGLSPNDIRYKNMLIDNDENLYVIDFGAAVLAPRRGTLKYFLFHRLFRLLLVTDHAKVIRLSNPPENWQPEGSDSIIMKQAQLAQQLRKPWKRMRNFYKTLTGK